MKRRVLALAGSVLVLGLASTARAGDSAESLYRRGVSAGAKGDRARAEALLGRVLALDPWNVPARRALDLLRDLHDGRTDGANLRLLFRGIALQQRYDWTGALALYRRAVERRPDDRFARHNLAAALYELGRNDEAIAAFEETLRLDPSSPYAHNSLGLALDRAGRHQEALAHYHRAIEIDPLQFRALKNAAVDLRWLDRDTEAQPLFRRALEVDPEYTLAYQGVELTPQEREPLLASLRAEEPEALLGFLRFGSWQLRKAATAVLLERRDPTAPVMLSPLLRERSPLVRLLAVNLLGNLAASDAPAARGAELAARALARTLTDPDWVVRRETVWALGRTGSERACRRLIKGLHRERDPLVRSALILALGDVGRPRAVPVLLSLLEAPAPDTRQAARAALMTGRAWPEGSLRKKHVPGLIVLLRDPEAALRARAAEALGGLGDHRALAPLIAALDDPEPEVVRAALSALGRLTGRDLGPDPEAWRRLGREQVR